MAVGTINAGPGYVPMPGLSARTVNYSAQCFVLGLPPQRDVGYVTNEASFLLYLWNGTVNDAVLTSITGGTEAEGILWDAVTPLAIDSMTSMRLKITVTIDGPLAFAGCLTLVSSCETIAFTVIGTRAPHLSGDIGYLLMPHNWEDGLAEELAWKTDVMIAHDRTEQRVQLRTLPRRAFDLRLLVDGPARRKLETWLSLRKTRFLFSPVWRDLDRLTAPLPAGETVIAMDPQYMDYAVGRWVAVFSAWDDFEIRVVSGLGSNYLSIESPFERDWPAGSLIAPCRYGLGIAQRKISRFTEAVADYAVHFEAKDETLMPALASPDLYRDIMVCPFVPSWTDPAATIDNKWLRLDNDVGLVEYDIQSEEPVFARDAFFRIIGRMNIDAMLRLVFACAGRLAPFWIPGDDRAFELASPALAGDTEIVIESIDYNYSLSGSPARSHVEMITAAGLKIRRMIMSVETLPSGDEKLTLDTALPVAIAAATLDRCAWLELVRLDSDQINLHWVAGDCVEITLPIVVLP